MPILTQHRFDGSPGKPKTPLLAIAFEQLLRHPVVQSLLYVLETCCKPHVGLQDATENPLLRSQFLSKHCIERLVESCSLYVRLQIRTQLRKPPVLLPPQSLLSGLCVTPMT